MTNQAQVRVTAAIIRRDGQILLARRAQGSHLEGLWEFPGGKSEPGETPQQCLARELEEEFGAEAAVGAFITASRFRYEEFEIELLAYEVELVGGVRSLNSHDEVCWVGLGELLGQELAPADVPIAARLVRDRRGD